jgi:hypothetical protein
MFVVVVHALVAYKSPGLPDPDAEGVLFQVSESRALLFVNDVVGVVVASVVCWVGVPVTAGLHQHFPFISRVGGITYLLR